MIFAQSVSDVRKERGARAVSHRHTSFYSFSIFWLPLVSYVCSGDASSHTSTHNRNDPCVQDTYSLQRKKDKQSESNSGVDEDGDGNEDDASNGESLNQDPALVTEDVS
jgi:hypothetical protein